MDALIRVGLNNAGWALVLAIGAAVVARSARARPALAHAAWLLVLLKLATPGLVGLDWPGAGAEVGRGMPAPPVEPPTLPSSSGGIEVEINQDMVLQANNEKSPLTSRGKVGWAGDPSRASDPPPTAGRPRPWLVALWFLGATTWYASVAVQSRRFAALLRSSRPGGDDLARLADRVATRLGLRRAPEIRLLPARVPPMLWALIGRPRVVLPEGLWADLDEPQREAVLAHEFAHLRRRDHWVRRLEAVVLGLYWWDPVAWWARREVERAEEPCCDAWVTWAFPDSAPAYAEALVNSAAFLSGPRVALPPGASGVGRLPLLKGRLSMILRGPRSRPSSRAILLLGALALPLLPALGASRAQEPDAPKPKAEPSRPDTPKRPDSAAPKDSPVQADAPGAPVKVKVARPIVREVVDYADFVGRTEALRSAEIRARVSGYLDNAHAVPGAMVAKGDLLFEIDPRTYQIELNRAEAEVKKAEARYDGASGLIARLQRLLDRDKSLVPVEQLAQARSDLTETQAGIEAASANRDLARLRLEFATVRAPIAGRVSRVLISPGNLVVADQTALASITALDPILVYFDVSERTILNLNRLRREGKLKSGLEAGIPIHVALTGDDGFSRPARIDGVDDHFDSQTGTLRVRASLPNPDRSILPGMFARVRLATGPSHKVLLVPTGLLEVPGQFYVVNDRNVVENRQVMQGPSHGNLVVVQGGLRAEDRVILDAWVVRKRPGGVTGASLRVVPGLVVSPEETSIPESPEPPAAGP